MKISIFQLPMISLLMLIILQASFHLSAWVLESTCWTHVLNRSETAPKQVWDRYEAHKRGQTDTDSRNGMEWSKVLANGRIGNGSNNSNSSKTNSASNKNSIGNGLVMIIIESLRSDSPNGLKQVSKRSENTEKCHSQVIRNKAHREGAGRRTSASPGLDIGKRRARFGLPEGNGSP